MHETYEEFELTDEQLGQINGGFHHWGHGGFGFGPFGFGGLGLGLGLGLSGGLYGAPSVVYEQQPQVVVEQPPVVLQGQPVQPGTSYTLTGC